MAMMMGQRVPVVRPVAIAAAVAAALALSMSLAFADYNYPLIEYRALPELGQLRLTSGYVHNGDLQRRMLRNLAAFDRRGQILVGGESMRRFHRREKIGAHVVETTVTIFPPAGTGYRGAVTSASLAISIDGNRRIDCTYDQGETMLTDIGIDLEDRLVWVRGTHRRQQIDAVAFLDKQVIDDGWLEKNAR